MRTQIATMAEEPQELQEQKEQHGPTILRTKNLRQITFIPEAELEQQRRRDDENLREAGIARIYKQPAGTERYIPEPIEEDEEGSKKKKKKQGTLVMVMKSTKLKDPEWLPSQAGTWVKHFEAAGVTVDIEMPNTSVRKQSEHNSHPTTPSLPSSPRLVVEQTYNGLHGTQTQWPAPLTSVQAAYSVNASWADLQTPISEGAAERAIRTPKPPIDPRLVPQSPIVMQPAPESPAFQSPPISIPQLHANHAALPNLFSSPYNFAPPATSMGSYHSPFAPITEPINLDVGPTLEGFEKFNESQKRKAVDEGANPAKKSRIGDCSRETLELEQPMVPAPWRIVAPIPPPNALAVQRQHLERIELERESDAAFQVSLLPISVIAIPDALVRLACAYNNTVGVLLIKNDRSEITFCIPANDPSQTISAVTSIPMKRVVKPSIAVEGSRPMEFRIICTTEDEREITYRFVFGLSAIDRNAANFFRAKIEELKWAIEMEELNNSGAKIVKGHTMARVTEAAQIDIVKPFKCESCGKRFKNRDGIVYHQKRSQTGCNPNWTGPKREPKPPRIPKKPKLEKPNKVSKTKTTAPRTSKPMTQSSTIKGGMAITPDSEVQGAEATDDGVNSDDSDDSVVRWFEQVNRAKAAGQGTLISSSSRSTSRAASFPITPNTDRSHLNPTNTVSPAALVGRAESQESDIQPVKRRARKGCELATAAKPITEEEILREIFPQRVMTMESTSDSLHSAETLSSNPLPTIIDIETKGCQDIIIKLIEGNSGIFPGNKSIWYAFVPEFIKLYGTSVVPSSKLCENAVNTLLADNKLRMHTWEFQDRESCSAAGAIITIATFDISTPMADELPETSVFATLKSIIEMEYPRYYVPSSSNIDKDFLEKLRGFFEPSIPTWKTGTRQLRFDTPEVSVRRRSTRRSTRRLVRLASELANLEDENEDYYEELGSRLRKRKKSPLTAQEMAAQAELQNHMWQQAAPLMQSENGAWGAAPLRVPRFPPPKKTRARAPRMDVNLSIWQQSSPNFQNPITSAWDVTPVQARVPRRGYRFRHQLPEPITYMQDETGAWSFRPFGHGVKPIYQRPARRVYGNPHYDQYSKQIETGFRPIVPPRKPLVGPLRLSVRVTGKILPSRKRIHKLAKETNGKETEGRPTKRRNTRKTSEISLILPQDGDAEMSDSDYSEGSHFVMKPVGDTFKPARRSSLAPKKYARGRKQRKEARDTEMEDLFAPDDIEEALFEAESHLAAGEAFESVSRFAEGLVDNGDDVLPSIEAGSESGLRLQPRYLTSLENRFSGFSKNSGAVLEELNLPHVPVGAVAKANRVPAMTEREEARFITAVIVIRSLTGGLDMAIDWVLVGTLFKRYAISYLQKLWLTFETTNSGKRKVAIEKYQDDFQEVYATAYANGSVPAINYDDLLAYQWNEVISWTMQKLGVEQIANQDTLERKNPEHEYRKAYFKKPGAMKGRLDMAASVASIAPLHHGPPLRADEVELDDSVVAKSWARATVFTPTEQYDQKDAEAKLEPFANIIEAVTANLHRDKLLAINKGKQAQPGYRKYKPHSFFLKALYKKNVYDEQKFINAINYKTFLDQEFRSGKECVRAERQTTENICIISLQAEGRVRLQPVDLNLQVMGMPKPALENGQRQHSRKKDLEKYKFLIDVYPTDSYIFSDHVSVVDIAATAEPPRGGVRGELPLWYDIHDNLILDLWKKVLVTVVWIVHVRAGSSPKTLHGHFAPVLEEWELRRLLEWGQSVGLFKRVMDGVDGWTVGEWWWMIVGSICAG